MFFCMDGMKKAYCKKEKKQAYKGYTQEAYCCKFYRCAHLVLFLRLAYL